MFDSNSKCKQNKDVCFKSDEKLSKTICFSIRNFDQNSLRIWRYWSECLYRLELSKKKSLRIWNKKAGGEVAYLATSSLPNAELLHQEKPLLFVVFCCLSLEEAWAPGMWVYQNVKMDGSNRAYHPCSELYIKWRHCKYCMPTGFQPLSCHPHCKIYIFFLRDEFRPVHYL